MRADPAFAAEVKTVRQDRHYLRTYGVTRAAVLAMLEAQRGACALCGEAIVGGLGKRSRQGVLDHCHATGRLRGVLHASCNSGIGAFGDDPAKLELAARYLRSPHETPPENPPDR